MLEVTAAPGRTYLWPIEAELSPAPGAMGLESEKQGHCPSMGAHQKVAPQAQAGRLGPWGGSRSSPVLVINKLFGFLLFFLNEDAV